MAFKLPMSSRDDNNALSGQGTAVASLPAGIAGTRNEAPALAAGKIERALDRSKEGRTSSAQQKRPASSTGKGPAEQPAKPARPVKDAAKPGRAADPAHASSGEAVDDADGQFSRIKEWRLPVIGELPLRRQINILLLTLIGSLAAGGVFVLVNNYGNTVASNQTQIAGDALMHTQRLGKAAPNAIQGNAEAFKQLEDSRKQFNAEVSILAEGGSYQGRAVRAAGGAVKPMLDEVTKVWANSDKAAGTILRLRSELSGFGATLQK
ncbi:MAG: type IV pili methyl-accepting chemotaxis transducer N-terminal domain-containing protein, partial [Janthinobacterium lividum]